MKKLLRSSYNKDTLIVAKNLLGKILVHNTGDRLFSGKIVEVEAYKGIMDKAAHSYGGKRTKRTEVMYGRAGTSYVFTIYGMYNCFNIVTEGVGTPTAILIRAVEPLSNLDDIAFNRFNKRYNELSKYQINNLTNGPGKLCKAMLINKDFNGTDLCGNKLYLMDSKDSSFIMGVSKRIGIDYAEEAVDYPWRFYIKNNKFVSKTILC